MKQKVLVVDDEESILELITFNLEKAGFEVITASDGLEGWNKAKKEIPDLLVLDIMLPELDGLDVFRRVRNEGATHHIPVLFLTARREEIDRVIGLELGADDYVTKPFSPRELTARIKAILRRYGQDQTKRDVGNNENKIVMGELEVDMHRHEVLIKGKSIDLTAKEFELLLLLASNPGRVYSREILLEKLWGYDYYGDTRTVDVHIRHIRKKIEEDPAAPECILTVRGVGYKFMEKKDD